MPFRLSVSGWNKLHHHHPFALNIVQHFIWLYSIKAGWVSEILDFIKSTGLIAICSSNVPKSVHRGSPISSLFIHNSYCYNQ